MIHHEYSNGRSLVIGSDGKVVSIESGTLIYNGCIQRQPPWYLQIPLLRVMKMMRIELQVRDKFRCAFKIENYLHSIC